MSLSATSTTRPERVPAMPKSGTARAQVHHDNWKEFSSKARDRILDPLQGVMTDDDFILPDLADADYGKLPMAKVELPAEAAAEASSSPPSAPHLPPGDSSGRVGSPRPEEEPQGPMP